MTEKQVSRPATGFRWLETVDEAMGAMLRAIEEAQSSVSLETYTYTATPIGVTFRDALSRASERGVRVRVLVDSWGSVTLSDKFWQPLRAVGGEVRWFNPLTFGWCGIRDHRKLLVCDEAVAYVGGFNISSEYQGDGVTKGWFDLGLEVKGHFACELAVSFDMQFGLADFRQSPLARYRKAPGQGMTSSSQGQILLTGPGHRRNLFRSVLCHDLLASRTIRVMAAYFLPLRPIRRALIRAARHGARVQLMLGAKSDVPFLQFACHRFYQGFLRAGVEIYEYQPQILHGKLIVLDHVVYAGSANLDRRSFLANYELILRITDGPLASEAQAIFDRTLGHCCRLEPAAWKRSRTFWTKLKEHWAFFFLARVDPFVSRRQVQSFRSGMRNLKLDDAVAGPS